MLHAGKIKQKIYDTMTYATDRGGFTRYAYCFIPGSYQWESQLRQATYRGGGARGGGGRDGGRRGRAERRRTRLLLLLQSFEPRIPFDTEHRSYS